MLKLGRQPAVVDEADIELPDLLTELEVASGRDLGFFTQQWLQTAGVNTIAAD